MDTENNLIDTDTTESPEFVEAEVVVTQQEVLERAVSVFQSVSDNPINSVVAWMLIAKQLQKTRRFNSKLVQFQLGLIMEELSELVTEFDGSGLFTPELLVEIKNAAAKLKDKDTPDGVNAALRNHEDKTAKFLDHLLDLIWVTIGATAAGGYATADAWKELSRANFEKFSLCDAPDPLNQDCPVCQGSGMHAERDPNGKVKKPHNWREPNLSPYLPPDINDLNVVV